MINGPVEAFLAELERHLGRRDEARRRAYAEVKEHLYDLVAESRARGLDELAAETDAVDRFGAPLALARALRPARRLRRSVQVGGALAAAGTCIMLALSAFGTSAPKSGTTVAQPLQSAAKRAIKDVLKSPSGHTAAAANELPEWCIRTIETLNAENSDTQILVALDPRTGRVVSWGRNVNGYAAGAVCRVPTITSKYIGGLRFAAVDPNRPFG